MATKELGVFPNVQFDADAEIEDRELMFVSVSVLRQDASIAIKACQVEPI